MFRSQEISLVYEKVIKIGTNRKPLCDFLLVFHCNYVHVHLSFPSYKVLLVKNFPFRRLYPPVYAV